MSTVAEALRHAERRLSEAGVPQPSWDAELLLRHVLGWSRAEILADGTQALSAEDERRLSELVTARAARRPLQHLTGRQAFWRRDFLVTPDVLIPRPETEALVETALTLLRGSEPAVVVDVGTGSGCVALSIALDRPAAEVHATDVSVAALAVALENARRLGVLDRVQFHEGDLLDPVATLSGHIDLVVSNPPYVDSREAASLAPEVRDHEPPVALFAPGDAYSVYRRLASQAATTLSPEGSLLVEIGAGMGEPVRSLLSSAGFTVERIVPDLQAIPRVVVARRKPPAR